MSAPPAAPASPPVPWSATLKVYLEPATLRMLALGFSAGLPLLLVLGTLSFRLREAGIDRTTIGYLS
ncbi:MAG: AmpG family muropeptide MFS transporter, partial [Comamonadaceae bacterium]